MDLETARAIKDELAATAPAPRPTHGMVGAVATAFETVSAGSGLLAGVMADSAIPHHRTPMHLFAQAAGAIAVATAPGPETVAFGIAPTRRRGDYQVAVRIHSRRALSRSALRLIHDRAGDEADIRYVGPIIGFGGTPWYQCRRRPLAIGTSIAPASGPPGSIGCFVTTRTGVRLLSANHVLTAGGGPGSPIMQPAKKDRGKPNRDVIGKLDTAEPIHADRPNTVDCALVELNPDVDVDPGRLGTALALGGLATDYPDEHEPVRKVGRTTGLTDGVLAAFELTPQRIKLPEGWRTFEQLIEIHGVGSKAFSRPGDSGALVFTARERAARGTVIGGTALGGGNGEGVTYAVSMSTTLERLGATLVT